MKLTNKEKLQARFSKGLDSGDWLLITWLTSFAIDIPTVFWVVVWVQFSLSIISGLFLLKEDSHE